MLEDLGCKQTEATKICLTTVQRLSKNSVFHGRIKQIKIKFHFIREVQQSKEVLFDHCTSEDQRTDIFTKSLPK